MNNYIWHKLNVQGTLKAIKTKKAEYAQLKTPSEQIMIDIVSCISSVIIHKRRAVIIITFVIKQEMEDSWNICLFFLQRVSQK